MGGQRRAAKTYRVAVMNRAIWSHWRKRICIPKEKVSVSAVCKKGRVAVHSHEVCSSSFFEFRQTPRMIEMRVRVQQNLYVVHLESECLNVRFNLRCR